MENRTFIIVLRKGNTTILNDQYLPISTQGYNDLMEKILYYKSIFNCQFEIAPWQLQLDMNTAVEIVSRFQNACVKNKIIYNTRLVGDENGEVGFGVFGESFIKIK